MNSPCHPIKLVEVAPLHCILVELENTSLDPGRGLDFDTRDLCDFVELVQESVPMRAIDWRQGLILQVDGLSAMFREEYARVRQSVCLALSRRIPVPIGLEESRFRGATVLEFEATAGMSPAAINQYFRDAKRWEDSVRGRRLGDFARFIVRGEGHRRIVVAIEAIEDARPRRIG